MNYLYFIALNTVHNSFFRFKIVTTFTGDTFDPDNKPYKIVKKDAKGNKVPRDIGREICIQTASGGGTGELLFWGFDMDVDGKPPQNFTLLNPSICKDNWYLFFNHL